MRQNWEEPSIGCSKGPAKVKQAKDSYFFKTALTFQNAIMEKRGPALQWRNFIIRQPGSCSNDLVAPFPVFWKIPFANVV